MYSREVLGDDGDGLVVSPGDRCQEPTFLQLRPPSFLIGRNAPPWVVSTRSTTRGGLPRASYGFDRLPRTRTSSRARNQSADLEEQLDDCLMEVKSCWLECNWPLKVIVDQTRLAIEEILDDTEDAVGPTSGEKREMVPHNTSRNGRSLTNMRCQI